MDLENIKSASTYVNNLLLARGLLKNAEPIDFAQPEKASGGAEETLARIINLVNDLVVKRDKDAEQRESIAETLRELRNTETKQTAEIDRLARRNAELSRSLALAQGQERVFKATMKSAETTTKKLKEQMQQLKASIQQIRAQAATDIRKKDIELSRLKSHLSDRQRGKRDGPTVVTINGGALLKSLQKSKADEVTKDSGDAAYGLKQETNEYLSRLCRELSDENDTMTKIVKNTIRTLKDVQGGTDEATEEVYDVLGGDQNISQSRCNTLADEIAKILNSLRDLLTNSSYVPVEELEARDEEILRLREGWEKMEARWEEALKMMDKSASNDNNGSVPKGGLTRGTKRKAEARQTVAKLYDLEIGGRQALASGLDGKKEEIAAPRRNLETEGRTLRPRLTKAAPNALEGKITGSQLTEKPAAEVPSAKEVGPMKPAFTVGQKLFSESKATKADAPPKSPIKRPQPPKYAVETFEEKVLDTRFTRRTLSPKKPPVKPIQPSKTAKLVQEKKAQESKLPTTTSSAQNFPVKPPKSVTIAPEEEDAQTEPITQTPATQKSPEKQDSTKTNFSREETVILQRNAEHRNITKRRKESKGTKKSTTLRTTRSTTATTKPTPSQSKVGKQTPETKTPETKATPFSRKRKITPAESQSRTKRRKSARLAESSA